MWSTSRKSCTGTAYDHTTTAASCQQAPALPALQPLRFLALLLCCAPAVLQLLWGSAFGTLLLLCYALVLLPLLLQLNPG